jgi:hypothetical protein
LKFGLDNQGYLGYVVHPKNHIAIKFFFVFVLVTISSPTFGEKVNALQYKITTVFGNGEAGFSGDGGPALEADINFPTAVKVDNKGNVYFMESNNHVLRKLTPM